MSCKKKINIGKLNKRVIFEKRDLSDDGVGGQDETWTEFQRAWASLEPVSAWQEYQAMRNKKRVTHKVTCRYFPGLKVDMRITFGERIFQIHGIKNVDEDNRIYELKTEEGTPS
jgi:SPP1 family predicted phage head-tail adaptor